MTLYMCVYVCVSVHMCVHLRLPAEQVENAKWETAVRRLSKLHLSKETVHSGTITL